MLPTAGSRVNWGLLMMTRVILGTAIGLGVAAIAPVASAKPVPAPFTSADFVRIAPPVDKGCIFGDAAKAATPEQQIEYCTAGIAEFERLRGKAANPAEWAGLTYLIASYDFVRAGSYLKYDGGRSARVCASVERAYAMTVGIDPALFDTNMAETFMSSLAAMSRSAVVCRADFGTPAGAPATL